VKLFNKPTDVRKLNGGVQRIYHYPNGYGASVVNHDYSYTDGAGEWELAVLHLEGDEWQLDYTTHITNDVMGHLKNEDVEEALLSIRSL
jgi:hypothetical protein